MEKEDAMVFENFFNLLRRLVIGIWLVMLYCGCIWLVFGTFSTHQLQYRIQTEKMQDTVTVSSVIRLLGCLKGLDEQIATKRKKIKSLENALENLQGESDQIERGMDPLKIRLKMVRAAVTQSESKTDETIKEEKDGELQLVRSIEAKSLELRRKSRRYTVKKILLESERKNLEQLIDNRMILEANNASVQDYLTELASMQRFHFDALATMPSQLLSQILVLSMGALGSIIFLTRAFLTPRLFKPFSWYLFRPFLGMVTALAMFVLTKSGLGIVSGENAANSLNPFVISFIAIISGLLSEQAYERIQSAGESFFKTEERKQRWSLSVCEEMEKQSKSGDDMRPFVKASPKIIEEWVEGTIPVPADAQKIISAWLGKPVRELFSDQPPDFMDNDDGRADIPPSQPS
jgi:hypothetical protein